MELTQKIKDYLVAHPIDRSKSSCYKEAADLFGVTNEKIRSIYKRLRKSGLVEKNINTDTTGPEDTVSFWCNNTTSTKELSVVTTREVKTLEDLIDVCDIDTNIWIINSWECRSSNGRYSVAAKLRAKKIEESIHTKDLILKELYSKSPVSKKVYPKLSKDKRLLEVSIPDIHFGKLAHSDETGEDYDLKIAEKRFTDAINDLLNKTSHYNVEKILFPIGNDLINFDNKNNTTFNGTPQDSDSRFHKVLKTVKNILIRTIDYLTTIAPVDVLVVPGNHDETITFTLGEILDAYYHNDQDVEIFNSPKLRKYYRYGKVGIQLTHGDKENHLMLGSIFATEEPVLWGDTLFRYCQLGHFHKNKRINFVSVDEYPGFEIQILPSLSGRDAWHFGKGYNNLKRAKAFVFDKEKGLEGEFTHFCC